MQHKISAISNKFPLLLNELLKIKGSSPHNNKNKYFIKKHHEYKDKYYLLHSAFTCIIPIFL